MKRLRKRKAPKIPNALLKRYGKPVRSVPVRRPIEGESGPVRVYLQNGKPVTETLPAREKRFSRTFYRKAQPRKTTIPGADGPKDEAGSEK